MKFSPKLLLYFVLLVIEQFRRAEAQIDKISYVMQQRQGQVNADEIVDVPSTFQEYYIDHEWSEKDAREYLRGISHQKINAPPSAYCKNCTQKVQKYCQSEFLLKDHCCCDQSHRNEKMSYFPHSCYIGENRCYPHLDSCRNYREVKECCCDQIMLRNWKAQLSRANLQNPIKILLLYTAILTVYVNYIHR